MADLGMKKGDKVSLFMENDPRYICTWLGLCKVCNNDKSMSHILIRNAYFDLKNCTILWVYCSAYKF